MDWLWSVPHSVGILLALGWGALLSFVSDSVPDWPEDVPNPRYTDNPRLEA